MSIVKEVFNKVRCDYKALEDYGFIKVEDVYVYKKEFMPGFEAVITVIDSTNVSIKVFDMDMDEEFLGLDVMGQTGSFVSSLRFHLRELLEDIKDKCFTPVLFIGAQAYRIAKVIMDEYGDVPDFPFSRKPNEDSIVFRRDKTTKWYCLFMRLPYKKLGEDKDEEVDIINLKGDAEMIPELLKEPGFYPAYHMNKKHWFTITLDDRVDDEKILSLVAASRESIGTKFKAWIFLCPKYILEKGLNEDEEVILSNAPKSVKLGDRIYIYQGGEIKALTHELVVLKHHGSEVITKVVRPLPKDAFTYAKLNEYGIYYLEATMRMPDELLRSIKEYERKLK